MDAGLAAVLGTLVGGVFGAGGTLGAAFLTGHFQGRTQHGQWRREGRREAYSTFIGVVIAYREAVDKWMDLHDREAGENELSDALQAISDRWPSVRAAAPVVAVEGPKRVAAVAKKLEHHVGDVAVNLQLAMDTGESTPDEDGFAPKGDYINGAHNALVDISRELEKFTAEARRALDAEPVAGD